MQLEVAFVVTDMTMTSEHGERHLLCSYWSRAGRLGAAHRAVHSIGSPDAIELRDAKRLPSIGSSDASDAEPPTPSAPAPACICTSRCCHPESEAPAAGIRLPIARAKSGPSPTAKGNRAQARRARRGWRGRDVACSEDDGSLFAAMGNVRSVTSATSNSPSPVATT